MLAVFALKPFGLWSGVEPPFPIPNREVKHSSVHDTKVYPWDNRSRPEDFSAKMWYTVSILKKKGGINEWQ